MSSLPRTIYVTLLLLIGSLSACGQNKSQQDKNQTTTNISEKNNQKNTGKMEIATFGAGCFWCVEAVFQRIEGVEKVVSGYCNGKVENPTYKQVCEGTTGHAEVCQLTYNPEKVTFDELLEVFWQTHDPTTLNKQGNDVGTQYRSGVFYHNEKQKELAEKYKKALEAENVFGKPIVTEITPIATFYPAEDYHQNYYNQNTTQGYCAFVITPKVDKLKKVFKDKLKKN